MVKPIQRSEIQGFSKGLITDLNPLNSQIDTTVDEVNFELHENGTRSRRLGLDRELNGGSFDTGLTWNRLKLSRTSSFLWEGADGNPENKFITIQIGNVLYLFVAGSQDNPTTLQGTVTLPVSEDVSLSFGAVEGYLGVTTGSANIYLISYDPDNGSFSLDSVRIRIRDLFGIEETIDTNYETDKAYRGNLNWQHYYNLYNQGWAIPRKDWVYGDPPLVDAVYLGSNKQSPGNAPSNSDIVWNGIAQKPVQENSLENFEAFHYKQFDAVRGADTAVSKGHFIIDAFNRGSSRTEAWVLHKNKYPQTGSLVSGFNPPADATSGGPTSVAAHAGRLFYSGCRGTVVDGDERSPNYNNYVFFTQLIKSKQEFSKCYQEGDPTSRDSNDLIDTDGGFFIVSEALNIHTMYSMGDKLFLIAENGVWTVSGGNGYGFSATNFLVTKISTYGAIPNDSFVEHGGNGYFWGWDGIYGVMKNQYGDYEVNNLTKDTLDAFYTSVSSNAKQTCQGFVDKARRQIRWVYTENTLFEDGISKELILDLKFSAFYPFTITQHPNNTAYILAGVQVGDFSLRYTTEDVVVGLDDVVVGTDVVTTEIGVKTALDSNVKYASIRQIGNNLFLSFCEYRNEDFQDWVFTGTPVDAPAYMETNAFTGGDFAINKQLPYVSMAFANTERTINVDTLNRESSCIGRFMWNFSSLARSNKWSRPMQLYRRSRFFFGESDIYNGFSLNITKTKIRGTGKSLALRIETEPLKDLHVYGWSLSLTSNNVT